MLEVTARATIYACLKFVPHDTEENQVQNDQQEK